MNVDRLVNLKANYYLLLHSSQFATGTQQQYYVATTILTYLCSTSIETFILFILTQNETKIRNNDNGGVAVPAWLVQSVEIQSILYAEIRKVVSIAIIRPTDKVSNVINTTIMSCHNAVDIHSFNVDIHTFNGSDDVYIRYEREIN